MSEYSVSTDPVVLDPDEPTKIIVTEGALTANAQPITEETVIEGPTAVSGEGSFRTEVIEQPEPEEDLYQPPKSTPKEG